MTRTIQLPTGNLCTLASYIEAWRIMKSCPPSQMFLGFHHHPETAEVILREIRKGVHDRINKHLNRPEARDSIVELQIDRELIENAIHRNTYRTGRNLLRTHFFRRRYPHLNHRSWDD